MAFHVDSYDAAIAHLMFQNFRWNNRVKAYAWRDPAFGAKAPLIKAKVLRLPDTDTVLVNLW